MSSVRDAPSAYRTLRGRARKFVDHYLLGTTGVDAIKAAGFKGTRPEIAASKLLARPEVRTALEERRAVLAEAVGLRQEAILREMMNIAFGTERLDKARMLTELAEIVGLKKSALVQAALGPGLQVIVQQTVHQHGNEIHAGPALGVVVNLPRPG